MDGNATSSPQEIAISVRKRELPTLLSGKRQPGTIDAFVIKQPRVAFTAKNVESPEAQSSENVQSHSDESALTYTEQGATNVSSLATNSSSGSSVEQQPSFVHENDIGNFYKVVSTLSDGQKYDHLCNVWKPPQSYPFPKNSAGRKFQYKWFNAFPWLVYSKLLNGAFCIYCVLFGGESSHNSSKLTCLYRTPFDKWQDAIRRFNHHAEKSQIHATATERALHFRSCMENRTTSINIQYDLLTSRQVETNREKLKPIVEAVMLCGRQNIPLRGHRDDSKSYDESTNNPGNLQAMLSFLSRCGHNSTFEDHMQNAKKTATYRSKTTQNEIINICGEMIKEKITNEMKSAKFYSILADEAADVSNLEQMAIVLRFVDSSSEIREDFLGFIVCNEGLSGQAIATKILQAIKELDLDPNLCRGQGYDGAGNMSGKCNGASSIIKRQYPKALYVHCRSHLLNLCVASACGIPVVRNMMSRVKSVSDFFNMHPKRFALLAMKIKEIKPSSRHVHLIDVCRTRWIARIDGLDVFVEVFEGVVLALETIKNNEERCWSTDSVRDASGLFHGTVTFEFIICLVIVSRMLEITRPLTRQLQSPTLDVVACQNEVNLLYSMLERNRNEISELNQEWFEEAVEIAEKVGTTPSKPRTARSQQHRSNTPSDSPSEYYLRVISIPFLDHLMTQISSRFTDENMKLLYVAYGLPANVSKTNWMENFSVFLSMYADDLPEPRYLKTELRTWESKWEASSGTPPETLADLLPRIDKITFPNLYTAFQIAATVPVTSCSCERSISVLRRLKTYLRNTMGASRMNGLALLNVHREIGLDVNTVIDRFAILHPRRMKLIDILNSDP